MSATPLRKLLAEPSSLSQNSLSKSEGYNMLGDSSLHSFIRSESRPFNYLFKNLTHWHTDGLLCDPSLHLLHPLKRSDFAPRPRQKWIFQRAAPSSARDSISALARPRPCAHASHMRLSAESAPAQQHFLPRSYGSFEHCLLPAPRDLQPSNSVSCQPHTVLQPSGRASCRHHTNTSYSNAFSRQCHYRRSAAEQICQRRRPQDRGLG